MIRLQRNRAASAIPIKYRGPKLVQQEQRLIDMAKQVNDGQLAAFKFDDAFWKNAKPQLIKESSGKCAYCEAPTNTVAHGDVEHFRPKSVYWWLAYCYDNYLYACQICNQTHKGNKFPVVAQRLTPPDPIQAQAGTLGIDPLATQQLFDQFLHKLTQEQANLPNPYYVDPEPFFVWRADDVLKEVEILPNPAQASSVQVHQAIEECYGLNRKELKGFRYQIYKLFEVVKLTMQQPQLPDSLVQLAVQQHQRMKTSEAPFAGMIRYFDTVL